MGSGFDEPHAAELRGQVARNKRSARKGVMTRFRSAGVVACGDSACDHLRVAEARQIAGEGFGDVPAGNVVIPALGHGPVLIALVYAIGHVSGCHKIGRAHV